MTQKLFPLFFLLASAACVGCSTSKVTATTAPEIQRVPARFDFSPTNRLTAGKSGITIAMVKPTYVGKDPEYYVPPFNEMAASMGNDFEEMLTAKGFTMRGPFGSRDEMVYNDKVNSDFVMEIGIELNPQYKRTKTPTTKTNWAGVLDRSASSTITTYKMSGEITLSGNLIINAKSAQYGELLWKKNIALEPASFLYNGSLIWPRVPSMADELNKDNQVYNKLSEELEKFYQKALGLAWQQIDPAEMKSVGEQGKKADKRN